MLRKIFNAANIPGFDSFELRLTYKLGGPSFALWRAAHYEFEAEDGNQPKRVQDDRWRSSSAFPELEKLVFHNAQPQADSRAHGPPGLRGLLRQYGRPTSPGASGTSLVQHVSDDRTHRGFGFLIFRSIDDGERFWHMWRGLLDGNGGNPPGDWNSCGLDPWTKITGIPFIRPLAVTQKHGQDESQHVVKAHVHQFFVHQENALKPGGQGVVYPLARFVFAYFMMLDSHLPHIKLADANAPWRRNIPSVHRSIGEEEHEQHIQRSRGALHGPTGMRSRPGPGPVYTSAHDHPPNIHLWLGDGKPRG
ncbi:unnamed protein product [Amoebophrya sp. A25]|nr:unnamed protein product [Amoebophrya sp. A25]|eukprot:GSA25T00012309001.1